MGIKDYPHFCICRIILCNNKQFFLFSNMFLRQFKILKVSHESTQSIFCFDLPNFVLAGRFHAVEKDAYSAIEVRGFEIFPSNIPNVIKKEAIYTQSLNYKGFRFYSHFKIFPTLSHLCFDHWWSYFDVIHHILAVLVLPLSLA